MRVLLIEDEKILRISLGDELGENGYEVCSFEDPLRALDFFADSPVPIVISDIRLHPIDGLEVLSRIKSIQPDTTVILMTAYAEVSSAVRAMKNGAFDYLTKPFELEEIVLLLQRACDLRQLREENERLRQACRGPSLVGDTEGISALRNVVETAAGSDITVLLSGETGVGKDLTARLIHEASRRADHPFIKISCAQYSRTVLESELFGHDKGSFTGATHKKKGKFQLAQMGTVYLDDVDDLVPDIQVKLLRTLDEKVIEPVGSLEEIPVDIRIIASTKQNLPDLIEQGRFRADLYYRLNAYPISLPPLREHKEDIPLLVRRFWDEMGHPEKSLREDALSTLQAHDWPGNVRELKNFAGRLALCCRTPLVSRDDLPEEIRQGPAGPSGGDPTSFDEVMRSTEKRLLSNALRLANGNQSRAARNLGMKLSTFRDHLAKHDL